MDSPYDCAHDDVELRQRTYANDSVHYTDQCLRCGAALRTYKHTSDEVSAAKLSDGIPDFDETIRDTFHEQARQIHRDKWQAGSAERQAWYAEYLRSDKWRKIRTEVLRRDNHICQGCRDRTARHVHHLDYSHVGNEFLFELISLCASCHERIHEDETNEYTRLRAAIQR